METVMEITRYRNSTKCRALEKISASFASLDKLSAEEMGRQRLNSLMKYAEQSCARTVGIPRESKFKSRPHDKLANEQKIHFERGEGNEFSRKYCLDRTTKIRIWKSLPNLHICSGDATVKVKATLPGCGKCNVIDINNVTPRRWKSVSTLQEVQISQVMRRWRSSPILLMSELSSTQNRLAIELGHLLRRIQSAPCILSTVDAQNQGTICAPQPVECSEKRPISDRSKGTTVLVVALISVDAQGVDANGVLISDATVAMDNQRKLIRKESSFAQTQSKDKKSKLPVDEWNGAVIRLKDEIEKEVIEAPSRGLMHKVKPKKDKIPIIHKEPKSKPAIFIGKSSNKSRNMRDIFKMCRGKREKRNPENNVPSAERSSIKNENIDDGEKDKISAELLPSESKEQELEKNIASAVGTCGDKDTTDEKSFVEDDYSSVMRQIWLRMSEIPVIPEESGYQPAIFLGKSSESESNRRWNITAIFRALRGKKQKCRLKNHTLATDNTSPAEKKSKKVKRQNNGRCHKIHSGNSDSEVIVQKKHSRPRTGLAYLLLRCFCINTAKANNPDE